ncbi:CgeB family protein [Salidesulfovibrio onnuriiensis]|uniref:CgeB family protein n=1 Tax=Salidesulfovibrio onnuriiensis TaxID=2583823 RepID=UPI0011CBFD4A|nr:glycosyltransferase [Salidesulfovibrio onnuriiensis]
MRELPRYDGVLPKVLLVGQDYFILPELERAMGRLGIPCAKVDFRQEPAFLKKLFDTVARFGPDFILTVNHAGLDGEGQVLELLRKCGVPLASWFVDKHDMFLRQRVSPNALLAVFTWDPDGVKPIREQGVAVVEHLPLAADPETFNPASGPVTSEYRTAFVGSSWNRKISENISAGAFPASLLEQYQAVGAQYEQNPQVSPVGLLARRAASSLLELERLEPERQLQYVRLVQLEATRLRRLRCVEQLLPFEPAIVGDEFWKEALGRHGLPFTWFGRMHYERELPDFYRRVEINFNTTSLQSSNAVNQRVFDIPACGGFVLTDATTGLERLFEPDVEVATYAGVDDIRGQVQRWLEDAPGRNGIAAAAQKRILAQHTYEHRLLTLCGTMRSHF